MSGLDGCTATLAAHGVNLDAGTHHAVDHEGRHLYLTWVSAVHTQEVRERCSALRGVRHEGLAGDIAWIVEDRQGLVVATSYREGISLEHLISHEGVLAWKALHAIIVDIAAALASLHETGLRHGDLSPANILVTPSGRGVLVDIVAPPGRGTLPWAAPERDTHTATPASDLYALAAVLDWALAQAPRTRARLERVLRRAMSTDPALRGSLDAFVASLAQAGSAEPMPLPEALGDDALWWQGPAHTPTRLEAPPEKPNRRMPGPAPARRQRSGSRSLRSWSLCSRRRIRAHPRSHALIWIRQAASRLLLLALAVITLTWGGIHLLDTGASRASEAVTRAAVTAPTATTSHAASTPTQAPHSRASPQTHLRAAEATTGAEATEDVPDHTQAQALIEELSAARDAALIAGDATALAALTVPHSPAAQADAALLKALSEQGERVVSVRTEILEVTGVRAVAQTQEIPGWEARVRRRQLTSQRQGRDGSVRTVPAQPAQEVWIEIRSGRVWQVRAG